MPRRWSRIAGHRDQVKQAILNIAINALEAMPDGGTLAMTLERDAARARMRIIDTGPGIPPELRERIFDMHFTTKTNRHRHRSLRGALDVEAQGGDLAGGQQRARGNDLRARIAAAGPGS